MRRLRKYKSNAKERLRARVRAWRKANPDKVRAANRAYMKRLHKLAALAKAHGLDK